MNTEVTEITEKDGDRFNLYCFVFLSDLCAHHAVCSAVSALLRFSAFSDWLPRLRSV